jgi:all-trans-8'-apo-beta-carotenal 15,15'-oxygenase
MLQVENALPPPVAHPVTPAPARHSPPWLGGLQDLAREHAFEPLHVTGTLPAALQGTLYRNGPGRFGVGGERFPHWFDGDGMISAVRFAGGRASGGARLVRTAGLAREEAAGRRLFGGYGTPLARPLRELFLQDGKNTANTSVLLWQDRLFATCEAGKPYEVDREDLATLGERDLDGVVVGAFSAHSHRVPSRRCTYNFGLRQGLSTTVDVYALPDDGEARRITSFGLDGARLNHDFAATGRHLVFAFAPQYLSLWQMIARGKPPVASAAWRPERGTEIVVVPIDEPEKAVRFHVDAFLLEHVANAFEGPDGRVVLDCTYYETAAGLEDFVGGLTSGRVGKPLASELRRLTIDVAKRTLTTETVLARPIELPRVSPRVDAEPHRFVYSACFPARAQEGMHTTLLRLDTATDELHSYDPGPSRFAGEGVFVPRPGGSTEDDGWVLTMVYDARDDRSALEVLDARGIGDGPVASCRFDHPVPFGFHGAWRAAG